MNTVWFAVLDAVKALRVCAPMCMRFCLHLIHLRPLICTSPLSALQIDLPCANGIYFCPPQLDQYIIYSQPIAEILLVGRDLGLEIR
ncbi:hypothetical protein AYI70_g7107 [Smittium culicis]|uniref:Uncharacterized protein n=1 Tax=Smittium culicis TaxID=133412 RepID=A0A1R1XM36_9FUNG|nr:hypothetical protein AYI70_g7107 [Smittium culicis]